jgi:hypothetical protein
MLHFSSGGVQEERTREEEQNTPKEGKRKKQIVIYPENLSLWRNSCRQCAPILYSDRKLSFPLSADGELLSEAGPSAWIPGGGGGEMYRWLLSLESPVRQMM